MGKIVSEIRKQTEKVFWELNNVISCVPIELWEKNYCDMPIWKHLYHTLHSLDRWFMNPYDFNEPEFHIKDLNSLDTPPPQKFLLTKEDIIAYLEDIHKKIKSYLYEISDSILTEKPVNCEWTYFCLILAQYRHLHTHMGIIMGFIIEYNGKWPYVLGLENPLPEDDFEKYSE